LHAKSNISSALIVQWTADGDRGTTGESAQSLVGTEPAPERGSVTGRLLREVALHAPVTPLKPSLARWVRAQVSGHFTGQLVLSEAVLKEPEEGRPPIKSLAPCCPQMQCQMVALCNVFSSPVFVLHFLMLTIIEFYFVLMTSVYSQYLRDSCKQYLALIGS